MVYLSSLSFMAAVLYFFIGYNVFKSNRKSELYRAFFCLTLSLAVWSFAFGFLYVADNAYIYSFWNKLSAFGWCTFEAFILYFVLVLTDCKYIRHWYIRLLIMMPAFVFLYMVLFLYGPDIDTKQSVRNFFNTGNFIYNFTYLSFSIIIIFLWGHRSKNRLQKKQADIIAICGLLSFLLNFLIQHLLPALHIIGNTFYIGHLISFIMMLGVNYAITKYQFLSIPSSLITDELFNELTGLTFLTDSQGYIMKTNKQVNKLLNYDEVEMIGNHISGFISNIKSDEILEKPEKIVKRIRLLDYNVSTKSGMTIPFNITVIPLFTKDRMLRGLLIIGEDIRLTKQLEDEIAGHKLTNKKLENNEKLLRKILEITPVAMVLINKDTSLIKYQNSQAENLFGMNASEWIGKNVSNYFANREDRSFLHKNYKDNVNIEGVEIPLKKKDGTGFIGLVTVIPSINSEEELALACVVDMTKQKQVEEMLKEKNDYILKLNEELLKMNNSLINKSIKDGLTNLFNHQYMNEVLGKKMKEASLNHEKLCLMMMDIDHFKRVNDRFGHIIGDKVLADVSELIRRNTGTDDFIGRYGGEEFIVILSGIDLEKAASIAERVRLSICNNDYGVENLTVSISIGVTVYEGETLNALINKADMLLYQAKANGRNRVESILKYE